MAKINTTPLSGTRDFLPDEVMRRDHVIEVVKRVYQSYGFEPLETPTMERLTTLLGKYGEEGDQLIFRVMKRGAKLQRALQDNPSENSVGDAGMRYDLTVPLARVVAEHRHRLPRIFKRYQIQPVYRADRPAKGRLREFYQCDVDVVGSQSLTAEAEVLDAGAQILQELGFSVSDFGADTFIVDALPVYVQEGPAESILVEIAHELESSGRNRGARELVQEQIARAACKTAVRVKDELSEQEIAQLVDDLARTEMPYTSPRGRPTLIFTSFTELDRKFGRT